jgi:hypothetical protein
VCHSPTTKLPTEPHTHAELCRDRAGRREGGGHFFPEENPDDTFALIKQFLEAT